MDWKRLGLFALSELEQYAILLIRRSRKVTTDKVDLLATSLNLARAVPAPRHPFGMRIFGPGR
jgi:hypothetical protein